MSYTTSVKETLCHKSSDLCCKRAELYGFLLFSGTFSREKIIFRSDNSFVIKRYEDIFRSLDFDAYELTEKQNKTVSYFVEVSEENTDELIKKIGDVSVGPPLRIDYSAFENECCAAAFLRGVFIGGGFICSPDKSYHLEIRTGHQMLADDLIRFCEEYDIHLKSVMRNGIRILYIKTSEQIKDVLAYIGASTSVFDFVNAELEKSLKNNVNRVVNCEQANIEKSINASQNQIKIINKLKKKGYPNMSPDLIKLAEVRLENPEMTLEELGKQLDPVLSKSGVAHRMKKITDMTKKKVK
ncbi:MAG: DNA-binding protein WhiA [Clostridia bacterium]|nr:DNA-binding protein WhiA [Clostridia bacterium]